MRDILFCLRFLGSVAWRVDARRLCIGGGLLLIGALATPVVALSVRNLTDAAVQGDHVEIAVWAAVAGTAVLADLMMGHFAHLFYFELGEVTEVSLNRRLLRMVNGSRGLDQCEDPVFADGIDLLRQDLVRSRTTVQSCLSLVALSVQVVLTAAVLMTVQPLLMLLLVVAFAPVLLGRHAERALDRARQQTAATARQARHLRELAVDPSAQKELRLSGASSAVRVRYAVLQLELTKGLLRGQRRHALLRGAGQLIFALAYVAAILLVCLRARNGQATPGQVVLVLVLATQVSAQVASGLGLLSSVHAAAAGMRRFNALGAATEVDCETGETLRLDKLLDGLRLEGVTFTYPGTMTPALHDVTLDLPSGSVVAVVGENGAGKSTLVKLLTGLYAPTRGRVLADGQDLTLAKHIAWRARTATLFQDFARIDLTARESIGLGDLEALEGSNPDDEVRAALIRARASVLLERLDDGLDTLLGRGYGEGTDLSGGQWQSIGLARTLMRSEPLVLSLDEPGHALDPFAEQRTTDAYHDAARDAALNVGGVTLFVSHRLSTVRLADKIVVLEHGRVVEQGSHDDLLAAGGRYAQLWTLQSGAYA